MRLYNIAVRWQKLGIVISLATLGPMLAPSTSFSASANFCRHYARDYSVRYSKQLPVATSRSLLRTSLFEHAYARCRRNEWP